MSNESRSFRMGPDVSLESVVKAVETFCSVDKSMETRSEQTTEGYVLQASQAKDGWRTISGTRLAITVHFMQVDDMLNVTVGEGQWTDKIGAAAVGILAVPPLAVTAGIGAYRQKKLPSEIFAVVEKAIYTSGRQIVINGSGSVVQAGKIVCPKCKSQNVAEAKFCLNCGSALDNTCPDCGFQLAPNSRFCPGCGKQLG